MNVLVDIGHPAHVHMFRYVIEKLKNNGHIVVVTVKDIPNAIDLFEKFNIEYYELGKKFDSLVLKGFSQLRYNWNLYKVAKKFGIDVAIGSSITITHVSRFHRMKSIILDDDDDEAVRLFINFAHPFADNILSPGALAHQRNGRKDITYPGTHEVMYLHPTRFTPDQSILEEIGLKKNDRFFVLRFVAVKAYHDVGHNGLSLSQKIELVNLLKKFGKIFITAERAIETELQEYQLKISPEKIHHLLYYATAFVGDSQTMTTEAAILGTPAFKCNTFAGRLSIPNEIEQKYGLCFSFPPNDFESMIEEINKLLTLDDIKNEWEKRRLKFFNEKINVSEFIVWFIENYPESVTILKTNPDYLYNFR